MMPKGIFWGVLALVGFWSTGCSESGTTERILPESNGSPSELLIVADDSVWFGGAGVALAESLGGAADGLPQSEPKFKLTRIPFAAFKPLVQRSKSLLLLVINPDSVGVYTSVNQWARPQQIVTVVAARSQDFPALLQREAGRLEKIFAAHDRKALLGRLAETAQALPKPVAQVGIASLLIPSGFGVTLEKDTLAILRMDGKKSTHFMLFARSPWSRDWAERGLARRDSLLKKHFEGGVAGSYMATEKRMPTVSERVVLGGLPAVETRGLWRTYGDFMGGPFLSYTVADSAAGVVYTLEGLVYSPGMAKRLVLLEMEAAFRAATFQRTGAKKS
jgi:hypothetical protein